MLIATYLWSLWYGTAVMPIAFACDRLMAKTEQSNYLCQGQVRIRTPRLFICCDRLRWQATNQSKPPLLECLGNVRGSDGKSLVYAQTAQGLLQTEEWILTGSPLLMTPDRLLEAQELLWHKDKGEFVLKNPQGWFQPPYGAGEGAQVQAVLGEIAGLLQLRVDGQVLPACPIPRREKVYPSWR